MVGETITTASAEVGGPETTLPMAQLIVALECDRPVASSSRHLLADTAEVRIGRGERDATRSQHGGVRRLAIGIPDRTMSNNHARLHAVRNRWILEDDGSKNGCAVNGIEVERAVLLDGDVIEIGHTLLIFRDAVPVVAPDAADLDADALTGGLASPTFVATYAADLAAVAHIATSDVPVTVLGETGTGKEVIARALHARSGRGGSFVPVNCGALPESLVEAMLFGHRRGAFSGATEDRLGLVRSADKGTLFLDEIGDLPLASQTAFLRVLQEREVTPVGDSRPLEVDFRLVAATHRSLTQLVDQGAFRADLFARLSGLTLRLPRLADRRDDLGLLIGALLRAHGATGIAIHIKAARALFRHSWPLNVRELERVIVAALALARGERDDTVIRVAHLPEALRAEPAATVAATDGRTAEPATPVAVAGPPSESERLRAELVALLRQYDGNVAAVAKAMGKGRMQIHRWLKRFALDVETFRR